MAIFHFPQFEHELFCWYFKHLNAFLAQCEYYLGKWEILGIVDEGVNNETGILLQYFDDLNVDDAWSLLEWVAWDSFEFEKTCCVYRYYFLVPCAFYGRSYYAPLWCDMCNSSAHNVSSCPFYACYAQSASSLSLTQRTGFKVGESFGLGSSFGMTDAFCGMGDTVEEVHNLVYTPLEGCRDLFVHKGSSSLSFENVLSNPLEHAHVSTFSSQPSSSSPEYTYDVPNDNFELSDANVDLGNEDHVFQLLGGNNEHFESLGLLCGYDAALDPYSINLVDAPGKILWNNFFSFSYDFSMVFIFLKRALIYFVFILCMLSYL